MNYFLSLSIEYANQKSYLDDLFRVYPTIPEGIRVIKDDSWEKIEKAYKSKNNEQLMENLLSLDLFPIKDSYISYLRRDSTALSRNPATVNRICGRLYEMGLDDIYKRCSEAKETNRQIGPMFRNWLKNKSLGIEPVKYEEFTANDKDAILDGGDSILMSFAEQYLNYSHNKGLDFVGRFNKKYVIGEAKFLTDFGGHQNAQFNDAINTIQTENVKAIIIGILDGVLFIKSNNKMFKSITGKYRDYNIMSALVLREFLYQL